MAPEQAYDSHAADHRADIYALGCTLYRLLIGSPPYRGETLMQVLLAHREQRIPSLRGARPEVPAELDECFQRMLAKEPGDRQQSIVEVATELEAILALLSGHSAMAVAKAESSSAASSRSLAFLREDLPTISLTKQMQPTAAERTQPNLGPERNAGTNIFGKARGVVAKVRRKPVVLAGIGGGLSLLLAAVLTITLRPSGDSSTDNPASAPMPPTAVAPFDAQQARRNQAAWAKHLGVPVEISNSIGMKLVLIPPGEFTMSSPTELIEEELKAHASDNWYVDHLPGEGPQHWVRITKPFYLGVYEVTQGEYERVMGTKPSEFSATGNGEDKVAGQDTKRFPVEMVSWQDAVEFCRKLSDRPEEKAAGGWYRLPSEAQWEYACRAGNTGRYGLSSDRSEVPKDYEEHELLDYGWVNANSSGTTHAVGGKRANAWGLHDMHGNVWEWCQDWYDKAYYTSSPIDDPGGPPGGSNRVSRGGAWNNPARGSRSAYRGNSDPGHRLDILGFRVSRVLAHTAAERAKVPVLSTDDRWTPWRDLFDGKTLAGWRVVDDPPEFSSHGKVSVRERELILAIGDPATGIVSTQTVPRVDYEISLEARRTHGTGSMCEIFFPFQNEHCKLAVAGDNTMVCLEMVNDRPGPQNATQRRFDCEDGCWYCIRLRVLAAKIEAWVDDKKMVDFNPTAQKLSLHPNQFSLRPFGLRTWKSASAIRNLRLRQLKTAADEPSAGGTGSTHWYLHNCTSSASSVDRRTLAG